MDFNKYVEGDTLEISHTTVNIGELVSFLRSNTHITKLKLISGGIDDEDVKEVAKLTHLTSLDLGWNRIGDQGAEVLANGNFLNLTSLSLWDNKIDGESTERYILASLEKRRNKETENEYQTEAFRSSIGGEGVKKYAFTVFGRRRNRMREMENRYQAEIAGSREESNPDSELNEVQTIEVDQLSRSFRFIDAGY